MKIKIVTAIYSNLYGSEFGGRPNRGSHYIHSLESIIKMSDGDFIIYTSDEEKELIENKFSKFSNKKIITYDLKNSKFQKLFEKYKDYENAKTSDRSLEIQYLKLQWLNENNYDCDYIYWIDSGLSHCGIIPNKWLICKENFSNMSDYYYSTIFDNNFLTKLINFTNDKIFCITKENHMNFWSSQPNDMFTPNQYDQKWHVIGGLFGGKSEIVKKLWDLFYDYSFKTAEHYKTIWYEENILTIIFYNHNDLFVTKYFDIWWHENNTNTLYTEGKTIEEFLNEKKSFYKALEDIINN